MRTHELLQLKALPLFSEMKAESLESLLDAALLQHFPTGVILIHEGEPADFLHVLVDGLVEIYTEQNGAEWGISLVHPVSTFILAAVVSDQPYLNSARTLAESRVLLIPAQRVRAIFDQDLTFARIVARELAFAYRASIKKLKGYMARSSIERLANWILTEAGRDVTIDVREGSPASTIVEAAVEHQVDLVVIGTRGHTGLARIALGGTARSVMLHAPCSVLIVRGRVDAATETASQAAPGQVAASRS